MKKHMRIRIDEITEIVEKNGVYFFSFDRVYDDFIGGNYIIVTNMSDFRDKYPKYKKEVIMSVDEFKRLANVYNDYICTDDRARKHRRFHTDEEYTEDMDIFTMNIDDNPVESEVFLNIEKELLHKAMEQLTETQRVRLELFFFYGLTEREIAERLGINRFAVRKSILQSIKKLKKFF